MYSPRSATLIHLYTELIHAVLCIQYPCPFTSVYYCIIHTHNRLGQFFAVRTHRHGHTHIRHTTSWMSNGRTHNVVVDGTDTLARKQTSITSSFVVRQWTKQVDVHTSVRRCRVCDYMTGYTLHRDVCPYTPYRRCLSLCVWVSVCECYSLCWANVRANTYRYTRNVRSVVAHTQTQEQTLFVFTKQRQQQQQHHTQSRE